MEEKIYRLRQVLERMSVSKSAWWQGIKDGRYPHGVKIGPRMTGWLKSDIDKLIETLAKQRDER